MSSINIFNCEHDHRVDVSIYYDVMTRGLDNEAISRGIESGNLEAKRVAEKVLVENMGEFLRVPQHNVLDFKLANETYQWVPPFDLTHGFAPMVFICVKRLSDAVADRQVLECPMPSASNVFVEDGEEPTDADDPFLGWIENSGYREIMEAMRESQAHTLVDDHPIMICHVPVQSTGSTIDGSFSGDRQKATCVIDGWHRICAAYINKRASLPCREVTLEDVGRHALCGILRPGQFEANSDVAHWIGNECFRLGDRKDTVAMSVCRGLVYSTVAACKSTAMEHSNIETAMAMLNAIAKTR